MSRFATSSLRSRTRQAQLILLPPGTTAESPVGCCQETPLRKPGPPRCHQTLPHTPGRSAGHLPQREREGMQARARPPADGSRVGDF